MAILDSTKMRRFGAAARDGVIAVEVGSERVKYYVHKALLEEHSEYFKRALNGPWKEAEEKVVCLDDVECRTFEVFVDWLYTRKLPAKRTGWVGEEYDSEWYITLQIPMMKACAFANRMLSPDFLHAMEHRLIDHFIASGNVPFYEAIIFAFENLPPTSLILKALVDAHCRSFDEAEDTEENGELELRSQLPNTFLVDVMLRYVKLKSRKQTLLDRCDYHGHVSEDEKQECQNNHCTGSDSEDSEDSDEGEDSEDDCGSE
ncbi:hypothetical protein EKO04_008147 [Ascochyta lentis]|uniref:BTB domain-containing protein n=1 Tax=Ascochyta lentis TaxID=205686 RepID=A0A8H7MHR9_9PLEO|nr:hypothetical protein EKO04_008147 [Ascochyta lentis]